MKKLITTLLLAVSCSLIALAESVSYSTAEQYAKQFLNASDVTLASTDFNATKAVANPSYYVFNNPQGGWAIISGDDVTVPVLAYSRTGSFDKSNIPANMKVYFNRIQKNIGIARTKNIKGTSAIRTKWQSVPVKTKAASGKLLETALWGQDSPYNDQCPKVTGESSTAVTGCVATAMAIVMRYNKWPEHGNGTLSSYSFTTSSYRTYTVSGYSIANHTYNWDDMPLEYTGSETTAQKSAVAQLMKDCGVMVEMQYSADGSGAYSANIAPALAAHMFYSAGALELYRCYYSNTEWFKMLKAEIDANRPVIYGGADEDTEDGHQFVVDGYDEYDNVHINWGWEGVCNAYYAVCYLGDKDSQGVNDVFSCDDAAIFGLKADPKSTSSAFANLYLGSDTGYNGISLASGKIAKGSSFTIKIGYICNDSFDAAYSGPVKAVLIDKDGNVKETIGSEENISVGKAEIDGQYYTPGYSSVDSYSCKINGDIAIGDAIAVMCKDADGNWFKLGGANDSYYEWFTTHAMSVFDTPMIRVPSELTVGKTLYFELISGHKIIKSTTWTYDGTKNTKGYAVLKSGSHTIKAVIEFEDGTSATATQKINVK